MITAGLRKGPEVVIATLAAIRQLAMSMLRGPSPWKSAGLLVKAVLHVMRQRQIRPDVAEVRPGADQSARPHLPTRCQGRSRERNEKNDCPLTPGYISISEHASLPESAGLVKLV